MTRLTKIPPRRLAAFTVGSPVDDWASSIFKIYLPRIGAAADSAESLQPVQVSSGGTETILLVEDDVVLRNVCRVYLESKCYTVLEAGNAKEAMKICQSYDRPIHVLITHIVMPGLGGLELAKLALELRPTLPLFLCPDTQTAH
jgi:two-component system cell cycle sensor histidine kinase/response regulator CckA